LRPVKFAKYLPRFDIEPIIITRKNIAYHSLDFELGNEVRNMKAIKTESFDPARILYLSGMRKYRPKKWEKPIKRALNFPDNKSFWIPFAYNAGVRINFDYIFVTAPPFSSFIVGCMIAKRTSKPLILDFRDAWLEFPFTSYVSIIQKKFISNLEKKIVGVASRIVVVDECIKISLVKKYPELAPSIFVIPNGYDPDDFITVQKPLAFTISYLGTVRRERDPSSFLQAINELINEKKIEKPNLRIKFIGHIEDYYLEKIKNSRLAEIFGHLPYGQAIKEFCASHLAVLITTGEEYFFPSRQNEYLASGLPIIVCGKSKGIHLFESAFKKGYPGWVFDYNDVPGIKEKIFEIFDKYKKGKTIKGATPYKEYTREKLTKKLAELIKQL